MTVQDMVDCIILVTAVLFSNTASLEYYCYFAGESFVCGSEILVTKNILICVFINPEHLICTI
jgi:fucose permease